jgi:hypothetical protein
MILKIGFLLLMLSATSGGSAQLSRDKELSRKYEQESSACGGIEEIFKKKGTWKANSYEDNLVMADPSFPRDQYPRVLERLQQIFPMNKEALPETGGFEPAWYRSIRGYSLMQKGPVPASFDCLCFKYFCNANLNKISREDEATTNISVEFNGYGDFSEILYEWDINDDGKSRAIYQLPEAIGKWKGLTLYHPNRFNNFNDRAIVLTHKGQMPWHILTQKQYLSGYANWLKKNRSEQLEVYNSTITRMADNIRSMEANNGLAPDEKKKIVEKLSLQLKEYKENTIGKNVAATEKIFAEKMKPVQSYLDTASVETLSQQALLDNYGNIEFKGTFSKDAQHAVKLFCFTGKYFDPQLPRYVPQFIVLYWFYGNHPVNLKIAKAIEENFPVEKLKMLIDK